MKIKDKIAIFTILLFFGLVPRNACAQESGFKYDYVSDFSEGLAMVMLDGKCGFIDRTGKEVIPLEYSFAEDFHNGIAIVIKTDDGTPVTFRRQSHGRKIRYDYDYVPEVSWTHGKYGAIDMEGHTVIPVEYDEVRESESSGLFVRKNGKRGMLDSNGNVIVPIEYDESLNGGEDCLRVCKDGKWGYLNNNGQMVVPCQYDGCGSFSEGLAAVKKDGRCGFIGKDGQVVIPFDYDSVNVSSKFHNGHAGISQDGREIYIDKNGREVYSIDDWSLIVASNSGDIFITKQSNKNELEYIDTAFQSIVTLKCSQYDKGFGSHSDWGIASRLIYERRLESFRIRSIYLRKIPKFKYGIMDVEGDIIVKTKYDGLANVAEGRAWVKKRNKVGYMDQDGRIVIAPRYDMGKMFSEGLALVGRNGKCWFIDKDGKAVFNMKYENAHSFHEGMAAVKLNGKWGFIDKNGTLCEFH